MSGPLTKKLALGVLASGTGSNFEAIADAIDGGRLAADIRLVVCNRPDAAVLDKASARGIETAVIEHSGFADREAFDHEMAGRLAGAGVELVAMTGFDRIVTAVLITAFRDRLVNIHPALLPAFRGEDAQGQAAAHGVRLAGATVHIVDEELDHGPIVVQAAVPALPGEDAELLRRRILAQEHRIYPWALQLFAEGRVEVAGRKVTIAGAPEPGTEALVSPALPALPPGNKG